MSRAAKRDQRLLDQSYRALGRVSDWLNDLGTTSVDGRYHDAIGELRNECADLEREIHHALLDAYGADA